MGALQDGYNSVTRYYLNNFRDGQTQDCTDLFLGKFDPSLSYVRGQEGACVTRVLVTCHSCLVGDVRLARIRELVAVVALISLSCG
jgi:hypothetical protein